jgi:hypothetical protein
MIVLACTFSLGGGLSEAEKLQTAVAQTVTAAAQQASQVTQEPLPTITVAPTNTQQSAPTNTPQPCNQAEFVSETIPDNTAFDPNESFTKTWRLKNVGTCTWNTNYELVFYDGDKMSGPSTKNLTQSVAPGEQADISVDLKAPGSGGTYKGTWRIRDDNGDYYVNNIWVQIKVTAPLTTKTKTFTVVVDQGGSVYNDGSVYASQYGVGDNTSNKDVQSCLSVDISSIPSNATILEVKTDFSSYLTLGNPFNDLGCLRMYDQSYRPLDAGDYTGGSPLGAVARWCSAAELSSVGVQADMKQSLQDRVGKTYYPLRLEFNQTKTDNDNANDALIMSDMKIIVKYES